MPEPDDKETTAPAAKSAGSPQPVASAKNPAEVKVADLEDDADASEAEHEAPESKRTHWVFFGLGLSLQTLLWFLLFLAITIAVLVGNKLTEFRYVGF